MTTKTDSTKGTRDETYNANSSYRSRSGREHLAGLEPGPAVAALPTAHPTIEGVWQVAKTGVNCDDPNQELVGPFPAINTFQRDGTMTDDTGALEGTTNGYGSWQREPGSQNYSFRYTAFSTDENGALAIRGIITATAYLTDRNSFTASATIQFFDADGNLIATFCGRSTGTRFE